MMNIKSILAPALLFNLALFDVCTGAGTGSSKGTLKQVISPFFKKACAFTNKVILLLTPRSPALLNTSDIYVLYCNRSVSTNSTNASALSY